MLRGRGGFTLLEAMVVLFIIAIVATIAAPNLLAWRSKAKLRSAADNLKGDLELAKAKAAQINRSVAIQYTASGYRIFHDSGGSEQLYVARSLPAGVRIDTGTEMSGKISFSGIGTAKTGTIHLIDDKGVRKQVIVSAVGRIRIDNRQ